MRRAQINRRWRKVNTVRAVPGMMVRAQAVRAVHSAAVLIAGLNMVLALGLVLASVLAPVSPHVRHSSAAWS